MEAPPPPDEEVALVRSAFDALRRDRDPREATRLLDNYLRRFPQGKLAEEALGLAIEATASLGDPRAAELAARYLVEYPRGRFRSAAERAQQRFGR
jgi:hypothetical protein